MTKCFWCWVEVEDDEAESHMTSCEKNPLRDEK